MRRFLIFILVLVTVISLSVSVSAETQASRVSSHSSVSSDESCDVSMTVSIHLDEAMSELTFPLPAKATNITLNGSRVSAPRSGGFRHVDLTRITGGLPGDFSVVLTFHLNDVVAYNDAGLLVLQVPLLSGFAYPVVQLEGSVLLPGEIVTKPTFSSGYHNANIEQYLTFSVAGATVSCQSTRELKDHETLTMALNVTDAMFPQSVIRMVNVTPLYILMGVFAAVAIAYWIIFLRNGLPRFPVVTAPLDGYGAGQVGTIVSLKPADLTLMVFSWAQLGYVLIQMDKRERVLLHKRMDMGNERSAFEQKCYKLLFGTRSQVDATTPRYAALCQKVAKLTPNTQAFVHPKNGSFLPFRFFMALVGAFDGICLGLTLGSDSLPWLLAIVLGLAFLAGSWLIQAWAECLVSPHKHKLYIALVLTVVWLTLTLFAGSAAVDIWILLGQFLAGLMVTFGGRRTPEGRQASREVLGLLRYMKTLPRTQVSYILQHNPDYFHDLAPFAMALGVDRGFAGRFGKASISSCPYLVAPVKERLSAAQWDEVMQRVMELMNAQQRRMAAGNILAILRSLIRI